MPVESKMFEFEAWGSRMLLIAVKQTGHSAWQRGWDRERPAYTIIEATKHEPQYGLPYVLFDTAKPPLHQETYPHVHRSASWEFTLASKLIVGMFDRLKTSEEAIINLQKTFPKFNDVRARQALFGFHPIPIPDEIVYSPPHI